MSTPFAERVIDGMRRRGVTLRGLCREAKLDPSFFSKVLSGKRSPPMEEDRLRKVAELLGLDAAELVVAAGRIPSEWDRLHRDSELFRRVNALASSGRGYVEARPRAPAPLKAVPVRPALAEELL